MRMRMVAMVGALGLALAACGGGGGGGAAPGGPGRRRPAAPPTRGPVGQGEGKLSVLAWPGYAENGSTDPKINWVGPFEQQTGCKVSVKTFATSAEAVQLFATGGYDVVSASGDASLRLVYGDRVQPINTALVPNYADIFPDLKNKPWNSVERGLLRHPARPRREPAALQQGREPDAADVVVGHVGPELARQGQDQPVRRRDLHRRRRRLPHGHQARPRHQEPLRARPEAVRRRDALLKQQKPLVAEYWGDYVKQGQGLASGTVVAGPGLAAHGQPRQRRQRQGRHDQAQGGRHRLVGHVDGQEGRREHQLLVPVAELRGVAAGQRADRGVLRRGALEPEVVRAHREQGPLRAVPRPGDRRTGTTSTTGPRPPPTASTGARTPSASRTTTG